MAVAYERSQVLDFRRNTEVSCPLRTEELLTPEIKEYGMVPKKIQAHETKRGFPLTGFGEKRGVPPSCS